MPHPPLARALPKGDPSEVFRAYLLSKVREREHKPVGEEGPKPEFSPNQLADAIAMALGRFANSRGELKVDTGGSDIRPVV